jgi:hypothetical protein
MSNESNDVKGNQQYKDSVFTKLFGEKDKLAELYNAIAGTSYTADDIELVTLENVIFVGRENDVAFIADGKLIVLIEHQSTINPNMPLRCLLYVAREYQMVADNDVIYSTQLLKIPTPEFIVMYNGTDEYPEESELRLSDAFIDPTDSLELKVKVYNVNNGHSSEIMSRSRTLTEYSIFVERTRKYKGSKAKVGEALEKAVRECIEEDILKEFLMKYGSDVINMLNMEWNLDDALRVREKDGREKERIDIAISLLEVLDIETIAKKTKLTIEKVLELKKQHEQRA